jgi:hypothetical protein
MYPVSRAWDASQAARVWLLPRVVGQQLKFAGHIEAIVKIIQKIVSGPGGPLALGQPSFYLAAIDLMTGTVTRLLIQAPQCHKHGLQVALADFPGRNSAFELSAYRGG